MSDPDSQAEVKRLFPGDSEMARRMRAFDWSGTPLGPPQAWPQNLRVALGICLSSRFPLHVYWGRELTLFYNDALISFLGRARHPAALGRCGREVWAEVWHQIGPLIEAVLATGTARWSEDILMAFDRELPREGVYVTFSFSPVFGESGAVEGLFCACTETTEKIIGSRRKGTLRKLGVEGSQTPMLGPLEEELRRGRPELEEANWALRTEVKERRRAEAAQRESEERFRLMVQTVQDYAIFLMGPEGKVASWNEGAQRLLGYAEDEVLEQSGALFFTEQDRQSGAFERELRTAAEEGRASDENWQVRKDGSPFWASGVTTALRDTGGRLRGFAKIFRDLTERKAAEDALRETDLRLRAALTAARMGTWHWDIAADRQQLDESLHGLLGLPPGQTIHSLEDFLQVVHPDDRTAVATAFRRSVEQGVGLKVEFRVVWPDGSLRWLRDKGDVVKGPDGRPRFLTGACVDITDRKEDEEVRARDAQVLAGMRDSVIVTDLEGIITYWNEGATRLFGWSAEEMLGRPLEERFPEAARPWVRDEIRSLAAGTEWSGEFEDWRKDGSRVWIDARVGRVVDAAGRPFAIVGIAHDISERKAMDTELRRARDELERRVEERTAELRQSQQRALQAERLATIGETVATLAHDGRNALQRAHGCLSRLGWRLEGQPEELDLCGRARQALEDLEHLFDDVRSYAAPIQLEMRSCDLGLLWRTVWAQVVGQHRDRDARLEEELGTKSLECEADPFRLAQVFSNLFTNALEACTGPVRVVVACREIPSGDRAALEITVRDNGPGFTTEQRQRALEPFFTTKAKGTGLGLAIARRILEAHGGTITLEEGGEGGARFRVTLPRGG